MGSVLDPAHVGFELVILFNGLDHFANRFPFGWSASARYEGHGPRKKGQVFRSVFHFFLSFRCFYFNASDFIASSTNLFWLEQKVC